MSQRKCFNCECSCTDDDYCYGCGRHVCEGCNANGLWLGDKHDPEEHLDDGAPDSWPAPLSEDQAAKLRASMEAFAKLPPYDPKLGVPYDHPDCICTETVVGKDRCPVHGKPPSLVGLDEED